MKTYKPPNPSSFYPSIEHNKAYMQQNIHDVAVVYLPWIPQASRL